MRSDSVIRGWLASPSNMEAASGLLREAGLDFQACGTIDSLTAQDIQDVGALLIEEEGLTAQASEKLNGFLSGQPPWSDLPVILLVKRVGSTCSQRLRSQWTRSLTVVKQPVTSTDLVSVLRMALKERQRQYQVRDLLVNLQELNRTLEQHVAERTVQLERSNRDLEQFAHMASHDLQEPLRTIGGFLNLLDERYSAQLDDTAREYIGFAVDGARRMSQLISDLLAFSAVGREGGEFAPTDMEGVLAQALGDLKGSIEEAQAVVTHDPMPTVKAESSLISQLLRNLIGNAIKYRAKNTQPLIHIGANREVRHWVLSVRDNGIGIKAADQDRVFMIFQRLHSRKDYPGTGIGLAICKRIVEYHGGRIWVESKPGEGSTFFFTVPDR